MGALSFIEEAEGYSANECFSELTSRATYERGNDSYNGTINTCSMGRCTKSFSAYKLSNEIEAMKHIDKLHNGSKYTADYVDLGVVRYDVITYKMVNSKGKPPVVRVRFVVSDGNGRKVKHFETKKLADTFAMQLALKNDHEYSTSKEGVIIEGDSDLSRVVRTVKSYKAKPKLKAMPNRKIHEVRAFLFYGWAGY